MNKLAVFLIGVTVGIVLSILSVTESSQNKPICAGRKLEEFKKAEEVCGENNVRDKCTRGKICGSEIGFTCNYFRKAVYNEEKNLVTSEAN